MTSPLEHDYIGLGESSPAEHSDKLSSTSGDEGGGATSDLKRTELRLGLPGSDFPERTGGVGLTLALPKGSSAGAKRGFSDAIDGAGKSSLVGGRGSKVVSVKGASGLAKDVASASKTQVVGWPPIRNYRKNTMAVNSSKNKEVAEVKKTSECLFVKVSMDGAPYLRKVDLKTYSNYKELSLALEKMFTCFTIGQCSSHGISGRETLTESRMMDLFQGAEYVLSYEDKDGDWMLVGDVPWDMFTDSCRRLRIMKSSDAIGIAPRAMEKSKSQN